MLEEVLDMPREMIVVPYDSNWPMMYESEKAMLLDIFGDFIMDIQHFGSTSIKGLCAKPVIDILIVVNDISQIDSFNNMMISKGYSVRGENGIENRRYFVKMSTDDSGNHAHHIHVYQKGNQHIEDELMFRDYLRINNEAYKKYEKAKIKASLKFCHCPREYVEAKQECILDIMENAKLYYANPSN